MVEYKKGSKLQYDLILGKETMKELGILLDFKAKTIAIDETILQLRSINHLQGAMMLFELKLNNSFASEPHSTQDVTRYATQILDTKYNEADLQSIVKENSKHLSTDQQKKILQLLRIYELLFGGTLSDWRTKQVSFQLREGVSPFHGQASPVSKIHKVTIIKEVER